MKVTGLALVLTATLLAVSLLEAQEIRRTPLILREGGTPENPAVFDGEGLIIDLGIDVTDHPWKKDDDIWTSDGPINGREPLKDFQRAGLFIEEVPLRIVGDATPESLQPGQMAYTENGSMIFRWPAGKTPGEHEVILPSDGLKSGVVVACNHIIVRNVTAMHAANDGFNLHGHWVGIRLENAKAFSNGDEGISAHETIQMDVDGAEIAWNGSSAGGVADVNDCTTTYTNCLVHNNLGAAFFFDGKSHKVTNTVIRQQSRDLVIRNPEKTSVVMEGIVWEKE